MADLEITIGERKIEVSDPSSIPLTIEYQLEDTENFQDKKASVASSITVPASLMNSKAANSFHNPSVLDLTQGEVYKNPQKLLVKAKGSEIMVGKAILQEATHTDVPQEYTWNFLGIMRIG
jgi:hypothetical protein